MSIFARPEEFSFEIVGPNEVSFKFSGTVEPISSIEGAVVIGKLQAYDNQIEGSAWFCSQYLIALEVEGVEFEWPSEPKARMQLLARLPIRVLDTLAEKVIGLAINPMVTQWHIAAGN